MRSPRPLVIALALGATATLAAVPAARAAPGDLDSSFGTNGSAIMQFGPAAAKITTVGAVSRGPGGDTYVAGETVDGNSTLALYLARYLPNGTPDPGFGVGGVSIQQIGLGAAKSSGVTFTSLEQIAVTPSGDVVVPATASDAAGNSQVAVAEFTPAGALDTSFAAAGPMPGVYYDDATSTHAGPGPISTAAAGAAAVQSDGKILFTAIASPASGAETFVRRLNADGTVDSTFAKSGTYMAPPGSATIPAEINDVIVGAGGTIAYTGATVTSIGGSQIVFGELNGDGSVPAGFPKLFQSSTSTVVPFSEGYSVFQAAGGDYVVGAGSLFSQYATGGLGIGGWVAVAFTTAGAIDPLFGAGGTGVATLGPATTVSGGGQLPGPYAIAQQANGRLVFTGPAGGIGPAFGVVRTLANGTLDASFGTSGAASYGFSAVGASHSLLITSDGQLVVGGNAAGGGFGSVNGVLAKVILDVPSLSIAVGPAVAGQPVSFSANVPPGANVAWDLGSGAFTDATGTTAAKTYAAAGTYTVRAKVTDDDGQSATASQTVTVAAAPAASASTGATGTTTTVTVPRPIPAGECTSAAQPAVKLATKIISAQGLILTGTAAANCPNQVTTVGVAIARLKGKKCRFLTARRTWGKAQACTPTAYLAATGTYNWGEALKLRLTAGKYWVWLRAIDDHGASTPNPTSAHTALTVRRSSPPRSRRTSRRR